MPALKHVIALTKARMPEVKHVIALTKTPMPELKHVIALTKARMLAALDEDNFKVYGQQVPHTARVTLGVLAGMLFVIWYGRRSLLVYEALSYLSV